MNEVNGKKMPVKSGQTKVLQEEIKITSQIVVPDYMTSELGADALPEFDPAEAEVTIVPEAVVPEVMPARVDRFHIDVEGTTYAASRDRLYLISTKANKTVESFISSLIVVVADARDTSSNSWGKFVRFFDRDGVKKELYIRNSDITSNGGAIIRDLVDLGLQVSTEYKMTDALLHYLNLSPACEKEMAICSDRIGWHGNMYLFPDNSVIGNGDKRVVFTGAPTSNNHATKGTLQEWTDNVAELCKGNSMLMLAVCISFGAVLLRLLKIESGGYHIFGESSTGKSTTLHVGASVQGDPEALMGTWRTTANGSEGRAKKCNDSLMILDELHQSSPKEAGEASYMIMNGKGKQRANVLGEARTVLDWRLNCLSSGEVAYSAFISEGGKGSRAGQEVRMLDIAADMGLGLGVFENIHGAKDSHTFAEQLKKACSNYYGMPIRAFITELVDNFETLEENFENIKERFFCDFVPADSSGQVQRVATKFAISALAGELATFMRITGWDEGDAYESVGNCFSRWLTFRGTAGQQEPEKAISQIQRFLLRHGMSRFIPVVQASGRYKLEFADRQYNNMAGFRVTNCDQGYEFLVFPETFKNEMCLGLIVQNVTSMLVDRKYLQIDEGDKKPQVRHRMPGHPQSRYYHFTSAILSDTDEFDAEVPEEESE